MPDRPLLEKSPDLPASADRLNPAEFDAVAPAYAVMLEESLGRFAGERTYFAEYKVVDVAAELVRRNLIDRTRRILDFGAGCGESIPHFRRHLPDAELTCVDVSAESLAMAQSDFAGDARFLVFDGVKIAAAEGSYDLAFSACVFHHIDHSDHAAHLHELRRVLRRDGLLFIFEHNPLNPLTVRVVNRCPFDANAHLIRAGELRRRIVDAGFVEAEIRYRLFFPSLLAFARPLESWLTRLPFGAQYYVVARKGFA
jgi:SAM-dependent methyltransferase